MAESSQKFIQRNRAPRVQIEYDVEVYGSEKKVQLPFVMGVLSDLSGKPSEPLPAIADRKLLEIDVDNFNERLKSMKPRVAFTRSSAFSRFPAYLIECSCPWPPLKGLWSDVNKAIIHVEWWPSVG